MKWFLLNYSKIYIHRGAQKKSKENDGELHQQQRKRDKKTNAGMELQETVADEESSGLQTT